MSWNPVLNKIIEIKNEYQNKFGHIEYNYTEGYTDETETCLERWVSELKNPVNIIKSENEMIEFIENTEHFFRCPEEYESYFGFERKWDEGTGEILETTREYCDRGGSFTNIPDKYPCVIYFGVVDFDGERMRDEKLDWIYIGETNV